MRSILILVITALVLSGCSVAMASKKRGVSIQDVMACQIKACFVALRDTTVTDQKSDDTDGEYVTYRSLLPQGSTGRAVMHGLLDVATLGIWEVAGTPIEGNLNDDDFMVYTVHFDSTGRALDVKMMSALEQ